MTDRLILAAFPHDHITPEQRAAVERIVEAPIPMLLFCPRCDAQHVDAPQPDKGWDNRPHRSHECQSCGHVWRPADMATTGVASIETAGARDGSPVPNDAVLRVQLAELQAEIALLRGATTLAQLTLKDFIDRLRHLPPSRPVVIAGGPQKLGKFHAYRGDYSQLAIDITPDYGEREMTVQGLLAEAEMANGTVFQGWKGGDYQAGDSTLLCIAELGCSGGRAIVDVLMEGDRAVIVTAAVAA